MGDGDEEMRTWRNGNQQNVPVNEHCQQNKQDQHEGKRQENRQRNQDESP
jgi:hypothetical protein